MNWRATLAVVGAAISALGIIAAFRPEVPQVTIVGGNATRSHSFFFSEIPTGFCGPIHTTSWIEEKWSWQASNQILVGDSGRLRIEVEITRHKSSTAGPVDGRCPGSSETVKPPDIEQPMTIAVSGALKWGGDQKQTTPPNHPNPAEWSWIFTGEQPGDAIIQIELPLQKKKSAIKTTRIFEVRDASNSPSSRFVQIPVKILARGLVSPEAQSIIAALAWFVGPAFGAPWVIWLVGRFRRKREIDT